MQTLATQADVLGKMLVISDMLDVVPTLRGMAEFLSRALTEIPGIKDVYICHEDAL